MVYRPVERANRIFHAYCLQSEGQLHGSPLRLGAVTHRNVILRNDLLGMSPESTTPLISPVLVCASQGGKAAHEKNRAMVRRTGTRGLMAVAAVFQREVKSDSTIMSGASDRRPVWPMIA